MKRPLDDMSMYGESLRDVSLFHLYNEGETKRRTFVNRRMTLSYSRRGMYSVLIGIVYSKTIFRPPCVIVELVLSHDGTVRCAPYPHLLCRIYVVDTLLICV